MKPLLQVVSQMKPSLWGYFKSETLQEVLIVAIVSLMWGGFKTENPLSKTLPCRVVSKWNSPCVGWLKQ